MAVNLPQGSGWLLGLEPAALTVLLAGGLFLLTHLGITNSSARGRLIARLGENGYRLVYSLIALGTLIYLVQAYRGAAGFAYFWTPSPALFWIPKILLWPALVLLVGGFMGKPVSNQKLEGCACDVAALKQLASGVILITRHPVQWAFALWAASHLAANGDQVSVAFFASFLALALLGSVSIDRRRARLLGEDWQAFAAATSWWPGLAILRGRAAMPWRSLVWPAVLGSALYLALFYGHRFVSGVDLFW